MSGAWSVVVSASAARSLDRLPVKVAAAVVEFIATTLPSNPYRLSTPLRYELEGWRLARRGDYRVTLQIFDNEGVLLIGCVEHRADIYRRRG